MCSRSDSTGASSRGAYKSGVAPVLIVDDDPDIRTFLRAVLEGDGHTILEASTGAEALKHLKRHHPGLLLLDVMMPAMDGYAVIEEIRRRPGPFVPIILLTGIDDPAARARGIDVGADEVLVKPIHPFELRLRVRAMLRIQQLAGELHLANRRLRALARTDELTGLRNRRGLRSALFREYRRAERYGGDLSLIEFDVDRFKQVNDQYGHGVGDRVLEAVARALESGLRQVDVVGRIGGEEFVVVAPETPLHEMRQVAERLRLQVAKVEVPVGDTVVRVTISGGVASLRTAGVSTPDALLGAADAALYRAKALGRNRIVEALELNGSLGQLQGV
jgi:two-component system, cell cycle response regulator